MILHISNTFPVVTICKQGKLLLDLRCTRHSDFQRLEKKKLGLEHTISSVVPTDSMRAASSTTIVRDKVSSVLLSIVYRTVCLLGHPAEPGGAREGMMG
jgi:hypothetical protein